MTPASTPAAASPVGGEPVAEDRRDFLGGPVRPLVAALAAAGLLGACDLTSAPFDRHVHLLRRLGYGPTTADLERLSTLGEAAWLDEQLAPGFAEPALDAKLAALPALTMTPAELAAAAPTQAEGVLLGIQLKVAAIVRQVHSRAQLRERLVEFWSDHFNVPQENRQLALLKVVEDRTAIRPHALGRFADILVASAQSPAMLYYLDNAFSFAGAINENYARELLELHTVGVDGGYTEADVVATARLLTGWTIDTTTFEFRFVPSRHDPAPLTIMGWTRPAGGDPLEHGVAFLHHLASLPQTARFVCTKLARRFVADRPDQGLVTAMADAWVQHDSAIAPVVRAMVAHPAFDPAAGEKFGRPLDHLVATLRSVGADVRPVTEQAPLVALGRALSTLGQIPFGWPAPNGYPDVEAAWLNAGALLGRWTLVGDVLANEFPVFAVGAGGVLDALDGLDAHAIHTELARRLRFEEPTAAGFVVLDRAAGWSPSTVPDRAAVAAALPALALVLLASADAQYR